MDEAARLTRAICIPPTDDVPQADRAEENREFLECSDRVYSQFLDRLIAAAEKK